MSTAAPLLQTAGPTTARPPARCRVLLQRQCACDGQHEDDKRPIGLQAEFTLGRNDDPLEHEADRVAAQVLSLPAPAGGAVRPTISAVPAAAAAAASVPAWVRPVLAEAGQPLAAPLRRDMEQRFGHDFSQVRLHRGDAAESSARSLRANAYTVGQHLVFAAGRFEPGTAAGRRLLAHELTHVVQQSGGAPGQAAARRPAISSGGLALAREVDAGAPPPDAGVAGVAGAPRDAGAIAGAPPAAPASPPSPATPASPPVAAPSGSFGAITFRGSPDRIAPTRSVSVAVTLAGLPSGGTAAIDVEGTSAANGNASITAGASLGASGAVTVRGDGQTAPGNAGKLKLRATVAGAVVARSAGFTVAAWPADFSTSRLADINSAAAVGVSAANAWLSDGSALSELNEVERTERVDIGSRDDPPFTSASGTSGTAGTSGFIAGTASPTTDRHSYGKASIDTSTVAAGSYKLVYRQNFLFNDRRTGTTGRVVQNSGFTITHTVMVINTGLFGSAVGHRTVKQGAAVTVEGIATTAGSGSATSDLHML